MMSYEGASNKKSWIVFASLRLLFGGASMPFAGLLSVIPMSYEGATNKKSWFASLSLRFFICQLSKASFARRQIKNPALRAGLFYRAPNCTILEPLYT
jgi:hypothetical protein